MASLQTLSSKFDLFTNRQDAELDAAVQNCLVGMFLNNGQVCCAGSRVFVQEEIYDEFVKKLSDAVSFLPS